MERINADFFNSLFVEFNRKVCKGLRKGAQMFFSRKEAKAQIFEPISSRLCVSYI